MFCVLGFGVLDSFGLLLLLLLLCVCVCVCVCVCMCVFFVYCDVVILVDDGLINDGGNFDLVAAMAVLI